MMSEEWLSVGVTVTWSGHRGASEVSVVFLFLGMALVYKSVFNL